MEIKLTLGKTGSEETRNLLDKHFGCEEGIVFLGKLFDELLVLVESSLPRQYSVPFP